MSLGKCPVGEPSSSPLVIFHALLPWPASQMTPFCQILETGKQDLEQEYLQRQ
jgi:hypothetical protein